MVGTPGDRVVRPVEALRGELGIFPGQIATQTRWNGAACARFTRPVADHIVQAVAVSNTHPRNWDSERLTWNGDMIISTDLGNDPPERIEPDTDGRYRIGARSWVWEDVWCQSDEHLGRQIRGRHNLPKRLVSDRLRRPLSPAAPCLVGLSERGRELVQRV